MSTALPSLLRGVLREFAPDLPSAHLHCCQRARHFSSVPRWRFSHSTLLGSSQNHTTPTPEHPTEDARLGANRGSKPRKPNKSAPSSPQAPSPDHKPAERAQKKKKREGWQIQKEALEKKFQNGWNPPKKLSPDAMDGIRQLHAISPDRFTTPVLAEEFKVSPEAIRRILKSKWRPSEEEMENRRQRWEKRHDRIWSHLSELGLRPRTKRTEPYADTRTLYDDPKHPRK